MSSRMLAWTMALTLVTGCGASASQQYRDRRNGVGGTAATVSISDVPVRGAQVYVELQDGTEDNGELLAASAQAVTVLEPTGDLTHVDAAGIQQVDLILYASGGGMTGLWTGLGTLSALSHGWLAVISIPIWAVTGTTASVAARSNSKLRVDPGQLAALRQFARFPQGLPPGFTVHWNAARQHKATWLSTEADNAPGPVQ